MSRTSPALQEPLRLWATEPTARPAAVNTTAAAPAPALWAVAGGKGGTGKSFVASALGTVLAQRGFGVTLIDADIGGPNLHSFLGIKFPAPSLTDFFDSRLNLQGLRQGCQVPGLSLVGGDVRSLDSGSIRASQTRRLFRQVRLLDSSFVVFDLGSGSQHHTLDAFLQAERKLMVLVPERTSIENSYHFLKNAYFRQLRLSFSEAGMGPLVEATLKKRAALGVHDVRGLAEALRAHGPQCRELVDQQQAEFNVDILLNRARSAEDTALAQGAASVVRKAMGINCRFIGEIPLDANVQLSLSANSTFVAAHPFSPGAIALKRIADFLCTDK